MTRVGFVAAIAGAVLAALQLWVALVWEGVLAGLVLFLLGVAAVAAHSQAKGVDLTAHLGGPGRVGMPFGLSVATAPRPCQPVEPTVADAVDPSDGRRLVAEVERFLEEHRAP